MIKNDKWQDIGNGFQTFRLNRQDQTPTEWYIPWFELEQAMRSLWNLLSWKKKAEARKERDTAQIMVGVYKAKSISVPILWTTMKIRRKPGQIILK